MSGRQGEVDSVKSFAADAAGNEERARTGRQIMDLLRLNKLAEAQREEVDAEKKEHSSRARRAQARSRRRSLSGGPGALCAS